MTATPPGGVPPEHQEQRAYPGVAVPARLPIPGNAEWLLWLVVEIVVGIAALVDDDVNGHDFVVATTWLTAAYLISRGIAKASRVLEH